jgi:hypothetical protein
VKAVIRLVLFSSLIAACGGGSSSGDDDDTPPADSNNNTSDGPTGACTAESSYTASAATSQGSLYACETMGCAVTEAVELYVDAALNADATPDLLGLELFKGFGPFTKGITTGTFPITGDDANYGTCGACLLIRTNLDTGTGEIADSYMATGGTITITALTPMVTGTLSNVTFTHVTIDEKSFESTPVGDCDVTLSGDYTFSETATELTDGQ